MSHNQSYTAGAVRPCRAVAGRNSLRQQPVVRHCSQSCSPTVARHADCLRASSHEEASTSSGEEVVYHDSSTDIAFINLCRKAYGRIADWQSPKGWEDGLETYQGMIEVSRALMKSRTAQQQRDAVVQGFPQVPAWFRRVFPYSKWGAELNARITPAFFTWLVGPMETTEVEIGGMKQRSGVHIKRCRYLAESGCVGMCINLCKSPTQYFFSEQLGMPLTMKPNFEDYSCEMVFGEAPPPPDQDEVMARGCYSSCPAASPHSAVCHKLQ